MSIFSSDVIPNFLTIPQAITPHPSAEILHPRVVSLWQDWPPSQRPSRPTPSRGRPTIFFFLYRQRPDLYCSGRPGNGHTPINCHGLKEISRVSSRQASFASFLQAWLGLDAIRIESCLGKSLFENAQSLKFSPKVCWAPVSDRYFTRLFNSKAQ